MTALGEPTALLADLVALPSPSGDEAACAERVAAALADAGLDVERVGHSVIGVLDRKGPRLLLNSHHDTVPIGSGWSGDPLDASWRGFGADRRMVARGANDAKASVAAMIVAAAEHAAAPRGPGTLIVAVNACEETSNQGMRDVLARLAARGLEPHAGVTGEPTGGEVVRAQSGLVVIEAEWQGRACHAAHVARVEHENALLKAARALAALPAFLALQGEHPLLGASTLAPTVLRAGERHNQVPDRAVCTFDGRLAPPHDARACVALLAGLLPDATLRVRSDRLRPVETAADHPLVRAALRAAGRARAIGSSTMSDMALLAGLPAVKLGPGETARSHTPDEFVLERELLAGCATYAALIPLALEALA